MPTWELHRWNWLDEVWEPYATYTTDRGEGNAYHSAGLQRDAGRPIRLIKDGTVVVEDDPAVDCG